MRMPPLPADSIHARACKLKCEKILTRPPAMGTKLKFLAKRTVSVQFVEGRSRSMELVPARSGMETIRANTI